MRKTIEQLNNAREVLTSINNLLDKVKKDQSSEYPVGLCTEVLSVERELMYNQMVVGILEYWLEKVGEEDLHIGKHIIMYPMVVQTRITLEFALDEELTSTLYEKVFRSYSDIHAFVHSFFPTMFGGMINAEFDTFMERFERLGTQIRNNGQRGLCWSQGEFNDALHRGKDMIDKLLVISKDTAKTEDLDFVLEVYLERLFKHHRDDVWEWY